ncbi:DUF1707 SHOCT-like domain-containing protein [Nakamurella leprariae]|uniref:DUF1707 and DUF2154 domain-containing protein n=1 Tax=Nakamurella leprariae TaxID=2803911 RepID=A0A938YH50_9ACTN|nr:DUF1707 domain-containing protein [Nakamurella leprariae]MBM9469513.1 DUF1707 and DUF2154 domain-containing protein [Nakamurella leprariae]
MSDDLVPTSDPTRLRASHDDRERVAQALHTAMAEGRLTVDELQERLDAVYSSKTLGELEPLTRDLPAPVTLVKPVAPTVVPGVRPASPAHLVGGYPTSSVAIAVMSGAERKGPWVVPRQFTAVAFWGGIELDLTRARYAEREITITAVAVMGGIEIIVNPDTTVLVNGVGIMGGFDDKARCEGSPGAPVVRINGFAFWGGVEVRRPKTKELRKFEG